MKKLLLCIVTFAMLFCLAACGDGDDTTSGKSNGPSIPGKYFLTQVVKKDGTTMTGEEFDKSEFSITFREDGTAEMISEGSISGKFNWVQDSGKLYVVSGDKREEFPYEDGKVTLITNDGDTWIFTKK